MNRLIQSYDQSFYQLDFAQAGQRSVPLTSASSSSIRGWLIADGVVLLASLLFVCRRKWARIAHSRA